MYSFYIIEIYIWRRQWQPTPVLLPGKSHGRRSLVGCSPWGREESDTTEQLPFHFSLSCIGEGNGNPLQCSCLENPRDWEPDGLPIYGVAQSRTQLKRLSSSSSSKLPYKIFKYHASNLDWWLVSYMILYMFQCHFPKSSHPLPLPQSPKDCSIRQCLFCCLAYRVIISIFLNSIYMR